MAMNQFKKQLATKFSIKDLGEASFYMACIIRCDRIKKILAVDQHVYLKIIVDIFNVEKTSKLPTLTIVTLFKKDRPTMTEE